MKAWLLVPALALWPAVAHRHAAPPRVAVLAIDLNNLHKTAPDSALYGRLDRLASALEARLRDACGYRIAPVDPTAEAAAHMTEQYFYEHPDVAATLARAAGAEWVIIPRLNRASPWASDLQAHVVRVSDTVLVSNRIIELKGLELTPELGATLADRGAAWMADQVSQVIELSRAPAKGGRPCPP